VGCGAALGASFGTSSLELGRCPSGAAGGGYGSGDDSRVRSGSVAPVVRRLPRLRRTVSEAIEGDA
jgi:hypothetical protein